MQAVNKINVQLQHIKYLDMKSTKALSFGQNSYETDSFQKDLQDNTKPVEDIILQDISKHRKQNGINKTDATYIIDTIANVLEKANFLNEAKNLFEKSLQIRSEQNSPKKSIIDSYVNLQRIYEKLGKPEEAAEYKLKLEKEVSGA